MKNVGTKRAFRLFFHIAILMVFSAVCANLTLAETITFEEPIFSPHMLTVQYCNKGVEFLEQARIFEPAVGTSSGTHAVTNDFGGEFGEIRVIKIRFTTPQSEVSVNAGLDRDYTAGVYAFLLAFDSEDPGTTFLDPGFLGLFAGAVLGVEPTPINQLLSVTSDQKNIRSISVIFTSTVSNVGDIPRFELIDDLTFSDVGPPCAGAGDTAPPNVTIIDPENQEVITNPLTELRVEVNDYESGSGVAAIQVSFYDTYSEPSVEIDSFSACGGQNSPACNYDDYPSRVKLTQKVHIPFGTTQIHVTGWDFAGNDQTVYQPISFIPPGKDMNLWAKAMEITQAVQPWLEENLNHRLPGDTPPTLLYPHYAHVPPRSVPLVAGRTTVVRLYGGVEGTTFDFPLNGAKAALRCFQDPHYLNPCPGDWEIMPEDRPPRVKSEITLTPGEDIDTMRRNVDHTWNFVLPEAWTQQDRIYLEGEVIPPQGLPECAGCGDAANRIRVSEVVFNPTPFASIYVVRIRRDLDGQITYPQLSDIDHTLDFLGRVLPIDEGTLPGYANETKTFFDDASQDIDVRSSRVLDILPVPFLTNILGLIDDGFGGREGRGRLGEGLCYAKARGYGLTSAPEELGHAIGLLHAGPPPGHGEECIDEDFCESSWPYPHGTTGAFGFDVFNLTVKPPGDSESDYHDFMSYGDPEWVSPRTWIRFFNYFSWSNNWPVPTASIASESDQYTDKKKASADEGTRQYLFVRGQQEKISGAWNLLPVYEMDLPQEPQSDNEPGEYSIELVDAEGQILTVHRFPIQQGHFDTQDADDLVLAPLDFVQYIPSVEGAVSLRFKKNDDTLATVNRSAARPTLQIWSPTANGMDCTANDCQIRWTADDGNGDPLYFMVQYAADSGNMDQASWKTLAGDLNAEVLNVMMEDLPGGNAARVRVLATDGFNTTVAVSDPFFVGDKPPRARILESDDVVVTNEGKRRMLQGSASDMEDGLLGPERLSWHSSLDGPLGIGFWFNTSQLTPGTHLVTLKAEDSQGQYGEDSIEIDIIKRLNTQPTADAGPDIFALPGGTALLDGSSSQDPDGDVLVFHWQIKDQPTGSNPVLTNPNAMQTEIVTAMEGEYTVELTVHDGKVQSLPDRAVVTFVNRPPIAVCRDITVNADDFCQGDGSVDGGSYDPDLGDAFTTMINPQGPYGLGSTEVVLTVIDVGGLQSECTGTVTVQDVTPPIISCNAPTTITPPDAPISFTATAQDNCSVESVELTEYDCFKYTKKEKRVDKTESCVVVVEDDTFTIEESGGVGDNIIWTAVATDGSGNTATDKCGIVVENPSEGKKK